jgi:prophage maintenance system killer protein
LLKSRDSLESAVARPLQWVHYRQADFALQAAVLAHGISETQNFLDGTKRTAAVALAVFVHLNGFELAQDGAELADWILGLSGGMTPEELGDLIRPRLRHLPPETASPSRLRDQP